MPVILNISGGHLQLKDQTVLIKGFNMNPEIIGYIVDDNQHEISIRIGNNIVCVIIQINEPNNDEKSVRCIDCFLED